MVTGASGFIGGHLIEALLRQGIRVRVLLRNQAKAQALLKMGVETAIGDVRDVPSLTQAFGGCSTVVHLVGIMREREGETFEAINHQGTRNVIEGAKMANVKKIVFMSALGTKQYADHPYFASKWRAEEEIRASGIPYTIFRSAPVLGPGGDFTNRLARLVAKWSVVPLPGSGKDRLPPIYIQDVLKFLIYAIEGQEHEGRTYEVAGPDEVELDELVELVAEVLKQEDKRSFHIPIFIIKPLVRALEWFSSDPIITRSELALLLGNYVCDALDTYKLFGIEPTPLREALKGSLTTGKP